ncbi:MAG: hypothetical protein AAGH40_05940 [Verrucomicrobiota bacterium]
MKYIHISSILLVILMCTGCQKEESVTTNELMRAQAITPFEFKLPKGISDQDIIELELYDASGVLHSISFEDDYAPENILKVFLFEENEPKISLIHKTSSWANVSLPLKGKKLLGTRGDVGVNEAFAAFGEDNVLSWLNPQGDITLIRLVIKE